MLTSPQTITSRPAAAACWRSRCRCGKKASRKRYFDACRCGPEEPEGKYTDTTVTWRNSACTYRPSPSNSGTPMPVATRSGAFFEYSAVPL